MAVRRFVDREVSPAAPAAWDAAEMPWELIRGMPELGSSATTSRATAVRGMSPLACGLVHMELNRGDGSLGTFLGVQSGLAMKSIDMLGSDEQKRALAAGHGPPRADRRLRAHRARRTARTPWRWRRRARRDGDGYVLDGAQAVDRQRHASPTSSSSGRATTEPTARSRASSSRRARPATSARRSTARARCARSGRPTSRLDGVRVPDENRLPGAESLQGHRPRARRHPRRVRLGRARPRRRRRTTRR